MRLYLVVCRYSIAIQAGIQAMHVIPEMYEKYLKPVSKNVLPRTKLQDWAQNHKTVMVMRTFGGHDSVQDLFIELASPATSMNLPFAMFYEGAMNNAATAVGIVVPTEYYSTPVEEQNEFLQSIHASLDKFPFAA